MALIMIARVEPAGIAQAALARAEGIAARLHDEELRSRVERARRRAG